MDPITFGILLTGVLAFAISIVWDTYKEKKTPQKSVKPELDWDEEFLRTDAAKHQLARIEDAKVVWSFGNPGKPRDGFAWVCTCGARKATMRELKIVKHSFEGHQKERRETALARPGRFK